MERLPLRQLDLVIVPFPFSHQQERKARPVLIISNDTYNRSRDDVLVCAITSKPRDERYEVPLPNARRPSVIRVDGVQRLHKKLVLKKIGRGDHETLVAVRAKLAGLLA